MRSYIPNRTLLTDVGAFSFSVTMPLKTAILTHLDELTPATQATNACNTIVRVRKEDGSFKLIGTNTDVLGEWAAPLVLLVNRFNLFPCRREEFLASDLEITTPRAHIQAWRTFCARRRIGSCRRWRRNYPIRCLRTQHSWFISHLPDQS